MQSDARVPELDGLRGLAILLVLLWHASAHVGAEQGTMLAYAARSLWLAWSGVDLFFVLSGYLIGGILLDNRESPRYFTTFYLRRFFRIAPLYLALVALIFILNSAGVDQSEGVLIHPAWYVTLTQNIYMAIHGQWFSLQLGQSWSLAIEEQFYLLFPALIWITPRRHVLKVLLLLIAAAPILRIVTIYVSGKTIFAFVLLPSRMDALLVGALLAAVMRHETLRPALLARPHLIAAVFAVLSAAVVWMLFTGYQVFSPFTDGPGLTIIAAFYAALLLMTVTTAPFQRLFRMPWLRQLGIWSYGLYLLHGLIPFHILRLAGVPQRFASVYDWAVYAAAYVVVFAVAALSWRYYERPLIAYGHRFKYRP